MHPRNVIPLQCVSVLLRVPGRVTSSPPVLLTTWKGRAMRHALFIRATTPLLLLTVVLWSAFWFTAPAHARSLATIVVSTCDESHLDAAIANAPSGATITFQCPS